MTNTPYYSKPILLKKKVNLVFVEDIMWHVQSLNLKEFLIWITIITCGKPDGN